MEFLQKENQGLLSERQRQPTPLSEPILVPGSSASHEKQSQRVPSPIRDYSQQEDSPRDPDPEWEFCREFFDELTINVKELYRYEATVKKLARKLWPELKRKSDMTLSGSLLKAKTELEWEDWEYENSEHTRAGYNVDPNKLRSKEMLEGQPRWRLEWMRRTEGALQIYRDSPRELRVDPTFCPCERRYNWDEFARIQTQFPLALNYPKLPSPEHYTDLTEDWMATVCHQYLKIYADVPDFAIKMMCKFLTLLLA